MPLAVAGLIPHQGAMCLLDCVERWDQDSIVCRAGSHRRVDHPLRDESGLRGLCAIEYAAQAIAAHAGLLSGSRGMEPAVGLLAAVRDVVVSVARLDELEDALIIRADVLMRQDSGCVYDVAVTAGRHPVLTGRLSVMVPRVLVDVPPPSERRSDMEEQR